MKMAIRQLRVRIIEVKKFGSPIAVADATCVLFAGVVALAGCSASASTNSEPVGQTKQALTSLDEVYHHGGNLTSQTYDIVAGGPCDPKYARNSFSVSNAGNGSCSAVGWTSSNPGDCSVEVQISDAPGFLYGDCTIVVDEEPNGHPATFANSFQGDPSTPGTPASMWWFAGNAGIDVNQGLAIPGQENDGWVNADSGWNALNTWLPTTPGMSCDVEVWIRTSQSNFGTGYIAVDNEANTTKLGGVGPFGPWPGDPAHDGYNHVDFAFTATDPQELFYAGFWGDGSDAWMQVDDLTMTCQPQLTSVQVTRPWATGVNIVVSGTGFANGNVQMWYSGVPNWDTSEGPGWIVGGVLQASENSISGQVDSTFAEVFSNCTAAQSAGTVKVMAIDSAGNETLVSNLSASSFCPN
jgi:hypothetical protein